MFVRSILTAGLLALGTAGAVFAEGGLHGEGMHHRHPFMGASVEHMAMHNIMADLLSAKTGKSPAEIKALFEGSNPHEAMEKLGVSRDDMHKLMEQAHETLITKATAAGLISAEQAQKIRSAPRREHDGPPPSD